MNAVVYYIYIYILKWNIVSVGFNEFLLEICVEC